MPTGAVNPLSAGPVCSIIIRSLPRTANPQIKSTVEAIAVACHAGMLSTGFKLLGLSEEHSLETPSSTDSLQQLPPDWNANSTSGLSFRYSHPQSSMQYLLKINRLGNKTVVYGIGMGDDKTTSFDVTTADYTSAAALPANLSGDAISPDDAEATVYAMFIAPSRLTDLGSALRLNIIQRLLPSLHKEGYEETPQASNSSSSQQQQQDVPPDLRDPANRPPRRDPLADDGSFAPARPHPLADPSVMPRRPPVPAGDFPPPGFEDPYDINRGPRGGFGGGGGLGGMPGYGERDLYPPGMQPGGGLGGPFGGPGPRGGGMYMDFDDLTPGRGGGDWRAPPGARFDPPGGGAGDPPMDPLMGDRPRGGPRSGPGGGMPRFGGMGGAPPNPFGGFGDGDFI